MHKLCGGVPTRCSAANSCGGAANSSSLAASMKSGIVTVARSILRPSARKWPVALRAHRQGCHVLAGTELGPHSRDGRPIRWISCAKPRLCSGRAHGASKILAPSGLVRRLGTLTWIKMAPERFSRVDCGEAQLPGSGAAGPCSVGIEKRSLWSKSVDELMNASPTGPSPRDDDSNACVVRDVRIPPIGLAGNLQVPRNAYALVAFAHGSGSSRLSPRNTLVARALNDRPIATLLFNLLTPAEEADRANIFDIPLLANRLIDAVHWRDGQASTVKFPLGLFGANPPC